MEPSLRDLFKTAAVTSWRAVASAVDWVVDVFDAWASGNW
jgi:hypothetical protein